MGKSSIQPLNQQYDQLTQDKTSLINRKKEITQQGETTKENIHHNQLKRVLDETERKLTGEVDVAVQHKVNHQMKKVETALGQMREGDTHILITSKNQKYQIISEKQPFNFL